MTSNPLWSPTKHPCIHLIRACFVMTFGLCSAVLAQSTYKDSRIQAFGQSFVQPGRVVDQQSRMVFYRIVNAGKDQETQTHNVEQGAGQRGKALILKAQAGAKYQLVETANCSALKA